MHRLLSPTAGLPSAATTPASFPAGRPARPKTDAAERVGQVGTFGAARAELRFATADVHEALHRHPRFARLLRGTVTRPEYALLLACLYGFHRPLEQALHDAPDGATGIDLAAREKAPLLRADLLDVGMSRPAIDALPTCRSLPEIRSPGQIIGCLYVIEGAGLGGNILARKLDHLLGRESRAGRQFFLGRPMPDPLLWPAFCRSLERQAAQGDVGEIVGSARSTFASIARWLEEDTRHV